MSKVREYSMKSKVRGDSMKSKVRGGGSMKFKVRGIV